SSRAMVGVLQEGFEIRRQAKIHRDAKRSSDASLLSDARVATLSVMPVQETDLGRRERKSLRPRRQIVRAAAELVLEDGYERATIARIAERADLATRTVTTRFPTKEEIFFEGVEEAI